MLVGRFESLKGRYSNQLSNMQLFDDCVVLDQSKFYGYSVPPFWPFEWALSTKTLPWYCLWHWQREKSLILPSTTTETCEKFPFADWFRYPDKRDNLTLFYQLFVKSITTVKSFPFVRNLKGQLERLMDNKRYSLSTIDFRLCSWQYL